MPNQTIPTPDLTGFEVVGIVIPSPTSFQQFIYVLSNRNDPEAPTETTYQHVVECEGEPVSEWYKI